MKILAYDYENELSNMKKLLKQFYPTGLEFEGYTDTNVLMRAAEKGDFGIVFSDLNIDNKSGIFMLKHLSDMYPRKNYIGTSYFPDTSDAFVMFEIHASGYIEKPLDNEKLKGLLDNLRYKV